MPRLGRIFFSVAISGFGLAYLIHGRFVRGLPPLPVWTPFPPAVAYLTGVGLLVAGIGLALNLRAQVCAVAVGAFFVLCAVGLHPLQWRRILGNGEARTLVFEALALGSAALVLAAQLPIRRVTVDTLSVAGRWLFAVSMVVFGVQHFIAAPFLTSLVPAWLPAHLAWVYLGGVALIVAGAAIALKLKARLAAVCLGWMFLGWVVLLHLPRSWAAWQNGEEWTSLLVALGLAGGSWIVSGGNLG